MSSLSCSCCYQPFVSNAPLYRVTNPDLFGLDYVDSKARIQHVCNHFFHLNCYCILIMDSVHSREPLCCPACASLKERVSVGLPEGSSEEDEPEVEVLEDSSNTPSPSFTPSPSVRPYASETFQEMIKLMFMPSDIVAKNVSNQKEKRP